MTYFIKLPWAWHASFSRLGVIVSLAGLMWPIVAAADRSFPQSQVDPTGRRSGNAYLTVSGAGRSWDDPVKEEALSRSARPAAAETTPLLVRLPPVENRAVGTLRTARLDIQSLPVEARGESAKRPLEVEWTPRMETRDVDVESSSLDPPMTAEEDRDVDPSPWDPPTTAEEDRDVSPSPQCTSVMLRTPPTAPVVAPCAEGPSAETEIAVPARDAKIGSAEIGLGYSSAEDPGSVLPRFGSDPIWSATVDALWLHRTGGDEENEVLSQCDCGPNWRSEAFHDSYVGPRLRLRREHPTGWDLDASYWLINEWGKTKSLSGDDHNVLGVNIGDGFSQVRMESDIQSLDMNLTHDVTNWTKVLGGFRYIRFQESALATASGTLVPDLHRANLVTNELTGGQVGVQHTAWDCGGYFTIDLAYKLAIFGNQIDRETQGFGLTGLRSQTTVIGHDLEILGQYELTPWCSLTVGYQLLWLDDLALAVDQFSRPATIRNDGDLLIHGLILGLSHSW